MTEAGEIVADGAGADDAARAALLARLDELTQRLAEAANNLSATVPQDWPDQAIAREDDEVREGLAAEAQHEIAMVRAALARLDAGEYGLCARCGEAIGAARLAALPWASLCLNCASAGAHHVA